MKERRGWLWLASGLLMAVLAGLLTFQIVNELSITASLSRDEEITLIPVVVATTDIPAFSPISAGMITRLEVPSTMLPVEFVSDLEDAIGTMTLIDISSGEMLIPSRITDPTDPDSPVLYTMDDDQVLIALPTRALVGELGMLRVGGHIDIAYTQSFVLADGQNVSNGGQDERTNTTFLGLQNLEIKGLMRRTPAEDGIIARPEALLLAVSPQEALILKHLTDSGSPMDFFLRSPENNARMTVVPVDEQYLIDYFQLDIDAPVDFAGDDRFDTGNSADTGDTTSAIQSIIRTEAQSDRADEAGGQ